MKPKIPAITVARVTGQAMENGVHAKLTTLENSVKVRFNYIVEIFQIFQIYLFSLLRYTISGSS